jgi:deoxyribodipyrimidine photo-lyase
MVLHRSLPPQAPADLPNGFQDRPALEQLLRQQFPSAALVDVGLSPMHGGRKAAELLLRRVNPLAYGRSRNFLDGAVTQLSPYLRHGLIGLGELKHWLISFKRPWREQEKLISELAWRDFWQRVWQQQGDRIWQNLEPLKTGHLARSYGQSIPKDLLDGDTGLACIDIFQQQLVNNGWLHNHARMWFAAYLVHWRRLSWQAGARWFLQHLIDGDPASNNLSWQWVASCFSAKPYIFNRENLKKYAGDQFCKCCKVVKSCPFAASYEDLQQQLFAISNDGLNEKIEVLPASSDHGNIAMASDDFDTIKVKQPLLWIHAESLGPANPVWLAWPKAPALFVFDLARIKAEGIGLKRLGFVAESLQELPLVLRSGDPVVEIKAFALRCGCDGVVTQTPRDPHLKRIVNRLQQELPVQLLDCEPFIHLGSEPEMKRFSRFWRRAEPLLQKQFEL